MSDIAIRVEGLSKQYRIGKLERYKTLRDSLTEAVTAPFRGVYSLLRGSGGSKTESPNEMIWALKDVSFEVQHGEVLGVIGRNGAGKSTLLKVLSRITEPTEGHVEIRGRVGSLLEVGTGFHGELSGRENIYLNGAILGMRKAEIARKFDEIVAFAEVEKFIDTPVKHYSSGMYMRLAFAVAAHLEPEILIVDEVLAVGDAQFQKKCLGKMGEVAKEGRTVLFVSHNMMAIRSLCSRAVWLAGGSVVEEGNTHAVTLRYLESDVAIQHDVVWNDPETAPGNESVKLYRARLVTEGAEELSHMTTQTPFQVEFWYWNLAPFARLNISFVLYTIEGTCVFNALSPSTERPAGLIREACEIPGGFLNDGSYSIEVLIVRDETVVLLSQPDVVSFEVHDTARKAGQWLGKYPGVVRPSFQWRCRVMSERPALENEPVSR